jgi:glycine betaine/proline transport system substrate-binding protein
MIRATQRRTLHGHCANGSHTMKPTLRLGHIALSFHRASAAVVQLVIEEAGYEVELVAAPHAEMFEMFRRGEVDGVVSAWLPASHGVYLAPFEDKTEKLAALYEPYCIWGVPEYVPPDLVASVDDLRRPDVAARMEKLIQGINEGAGISRFSQRMIIDYGLAALGYTFRPGSEAECFGRFEDAIARGAWAIVPLWHPQWLHHRHRIRALKDPKGLLGGVDQAYLVMSKTVAASLPVQLGRSLRQLNIARRSSPEMVTSAPECRSSDVDAMTSSAAVALKPYFARAIGAVRYGSFQAGSTCHRLIIRRQSTNL